VRGLKERQDKWRLHARDWYASAHDCADGDAPTAQNKIFPGDIYREHKSVLWGAGNDEKEEWLRKSEDGKSKVALTTPEVFDWLVDLEGPLGVEGVRKLGEILQTTARSKIFRDFFVSERSEASKKRTKQIRLKAGWSFYTASVDLTRSPHRLAMTGICAFETFGRRL
jgi:hypothetical protein